MTSFRISFVPAVAAWLLLLAAGSAEAATVGYWRFEEGSGTTAADSSGNGNNGTLLNGADFSIIAPEIWNLPNNYSLGFDGTDDAMEVPDDPTLDLAGAFTLESFVYPSILGVPTGAGIVLKRNAAGNSTSYGLLFGVDERVRVQIHTTGAGTVSPAASAPLSNRWHHVAGVYTGSQLRLYVDYQLVSSVPIAQPLQTSNFPLEAGTYAAFFQGLLDEVRLSNVALSPIQFVGATLFEDGFEAGNTYAWSSTVP
jgi:hypothetical protein